jgi:hypothetical protein
MNHRLKGLERAILVLLSCLAVSCASLIEGESGMSRPVTFTSSPAGALICMNDVPQGTTPTVITFSPWSIAKAKFTASKSGYRTVSVNPKSGLSATVAGNAVLGGVGGILVDGISGSAIRNAKHVHIDLEPLAKE